MRTATKLLSLTAIALGLSACGGGGGSAGPAANINVSGSQTVTKLGSIVTSNASNTEKAGYINGATSLYITTNNSGTITGPGGACTISGTTTSTIYAKGTKSTSTSIDVCGETTSDYETSTVTFNTNGTITDEDGWTFKPNGTTTNTETIHYGSDIIAASISVNATSLPQIDVVDGDDNNSNDNFFITNIGTGTKDYGTYNVDYTNTGLNTADNTALQAAHASKWTGKGFDIELSQDSNLNDNSGTHIQAKNIAPGAEFYISNDSTKSRVCKDTAGQNGSAAWCENNDHVTFVGDERDVTASATSIVWHKFDTLSGAQIRDLIYDTGYDLGKALSPVGNLN